MLYLANPCSPQVLDAMRTGYLGFIDTPAQGNVRPAGLAWCADNGAFGKGYPGDDAYLEWLDEQPERESCLFAVAPDVVCDHQRTFRRSDRVMHHIQALGYPVAFVGQNGAHPYNVPWRDIDVLFLGGDTDWKLGEAARELVAYAKQLGKRVHMGRVNSQRRMRYAQFIGCDSVDGTYLTFGPDTNLPKLLGWVEGERTQPMLWEAS